MLWAVSLWLNSDELLEQIPGRTRGGGAWGGGGGRGARFDGQAAAPWQQHDWQVCLERVLSCTDQGPLPDGQQKVSKTYLWEADHVLWNVINLIYSWAHDVFLKRLSDTSDTQWEETFCYCEHEYRWTPEVTKWKILFNILIRLCLF